MPNLRKMPPEPGILAEGCKGTSLTTRQSEGTRKTNEIDSRHCADRRTVRDLTGKSGLNPPCRDRACKQPLTRLFAFIVPSRVTLKVDAFAVRSACARPLLAILPAHLRNDFVHPGSWRDATSLRFWRSIDRDWTVHEAVRSGIRACERLPQCRAFDLLAAGGHSTVKLSCDSRITIQSIRLSSHRLVAWLVPPLVCARTAICTARCHKPRMMAASTVARGQVAIRQRAYFKHRLIPFKADLLSDLLLRAQGHLVQSEAPRG